MSGHEQTRNGRKLTRRSLLRRGGTVGAAAAAGALVLPQLASGTNKDHPGSLRLTVKNACFTSGPSDSELDAGLGQKGLWVNNFVVVGDIAYVDDKALKTPGKYYCKGVIFPLSNLSVGGKDAECATPHEGTYVDQYFAIPGMGSINGAGTEGDPAGLAPPNRFDDLTITGGTGMFLGACGDYGSLKPPPDGTGTEGEGPRQFGGTGTITFEFNLWHKAHRGHQHHHSSPKRRRLGRGKDDD